MKAKKANAAMPYKSTDGSGKKLRSWKEKQRAFTMTGLKTLRAPWAGLSKSLVFHSFVRVWFQVTLQP